MDTLLSPILDALRVNVAAQLNGTLGGDPCSTAIYAGTQAVADRCTCAGKACGGMAWVRLARMFPSGTRFPGPDVDTKTSCTIVLAAVIEVGVFRCQPTVNPDGSPPSAADLTQAALVAADDALALHRALACTPEVTSRPHLLGTYEPRDSGDCGGGTWPVTVSLRRR